MINIGIDIGKFKHCATVLDDKSGEFLVSPFFFTNNQNGFEVFYSNIKPFLHRKHACGLESTGHYGKNLINFLLDKKVNTFYINPRSTALRRKELGKNAKNNKLDTIMISEMLSEKKFWKPISRTSMEMDSLKELTRLYHQLQEQQNQDQNRLQRALDIVFPEYNKLSWCAYSFAYMQVLRSFPSASKIAQTDIRNLRNCLQREGRGRSTSVSAEELKELAKSSIGDVDNIAVELEIVSIISIIDTRDEQLSILEKKIEEFSTILNSPITSIPGVGHITGMTILAEIGDITRFSDASNLISYAGMNPAVYQSGIYDAAHLPISKHGSRYLRKALYQAIFTVCKYSPTFHKYYTSKKDQGKPYRCAQGHAVRKLLRLIHKLLSTNTTFDQSLSK